MAAFKDGESATDDLKESWLNKRFAGPVKERNGRMLLTLKVALAGKHRRRQTFLEYYEGRLHERYLECLSSVGPFF